MKRWMQKESKTIDVNKAKVPREPQSLPVDREQINSASGTKGPVQKVTIVVLWAMTQRSFFGRFQCFGGICAPAIRKLQNHADSE